MKIPTNAESIPSAETDADNEQMLRLITSSHACTKPHVVRRIICVFLGHKSKDKFCQRCGQQFGIPKYNAPPPPPKRVIT